MACPIRYCTAGGRGTFPKTVNTVVLSLPADMTVLFMTRWSLATTEEDDCALDDARSLLCAEREVSNTASLLDAESLDVSSSGVLNGVSS